MANSRARTILMVLVALIVCSLVALAAVVALSYLQPQTVDTGGPVVTIRSPRHGEQVQQGQPVAIHVVAVDQQKITRAELWVDGELRQAQSSTLPEGSTSLPLVTHWLPESAGQHKLVARAFNAQGERAYVSIEIQAEEEISGDAPPDDEPIGEAEEGEVTVIALSVDSDGDGVPDASDASPNEPGPAGSDGSPAPTFGDQDGDGLSDGEGGDDDCPEQPGSPATQGCPDGDGDGVRDSEDDCPEQGGLPQNAGCPPPQAMLPVPAPEGGEGPDESPGGEGGVPKSPGDMDDDGVPDELDMCPEEPGLPEYAGCPPGEDSDGDGIPDDVDLCPEEAGTAANGGCPPGADSDGDGVPDDVDLCPDEEGLPGHAGCPPPPDDVFELPEDMEMGADIPDIEGTPGAIVEIQGLSFEVNADYTEVHCYITLEEYDPERYEFGPLGERQWDIAAEMGSRRIIAREDSLEVRIECGAHVIYEAWPGESWGTYYELGSIAVSHPPADWDGHVIRYRSGGGSDGHWFDVEYRICLTSCDDTVFPPPVLTREGDYLGWTWEGNTDDIDGFYVYVDGNRGVSVESSATVVNIARYTPLCGSEREFTLTAYREGWGESPHSNIATWRADTCPRVVRVTFDRIHTYGIDDSGPWGRDGLQGPVFGSFGAWGGDSGDSLSYNGSDYPDGVGFAPHSVYTVQSLFDTINAWDASCIGRGCPAFIYAPEVDYVMVELGPDHDLTFGGTIYDQDWRVYQEAFLAHQTLPAGEIVPGRYSLTDGQYRLDVLVDVLVGPEAGDRPDLVISNVTTHEPSGQLRVYVFNNAADLIDTDITLNLVRISTNTQIALETWENVTIPSGGYRILQRGDDTVDARDLRVIVDPDNDIPEMNDGNNMYETD